MSNLLLLSGFRTKQNHSILCYLSSPACYFIILFTVSQIYFTFLDLPWFFVCLFVLNYKSTYKILARHILFVSQDIAAFSKIPSSVPKRWVCIM